MPVNTKKLKCGHCHKKIGNREMVMAAGKVWHSDHFFCTHCKKSLKGSEYFEEDGEVYCEEDYNDLILHPTLPTCESCKKHIKGKYFTAFDKSWHKDHFVCAQCKKPLKKGVYFPEDGLPYCKHDHEKLFKDRSATPETHAQEEFSKSAKKHKKSSKDRRGSSKSQGSSRGSSKSQGSSKERRSSPAEAKKDSSGEYPVCASCKAAITDFVMTALGQQWHKEHFVCAQCKKPITTTEFSTHGRKPYCDKDYKTLFGKKCSACGDEITDILVTALDKPWHKLCFKCEKCKKPISAPQGFSAKEGKTFCLVCSN